MTRYRIFLTTSPLATYFMTAFAVRSCQRGDCDILVLDYLKQKESVVSQIKKIASMHAFDQVLDFTLPLAEEGSTKPGLIKKWTRFVKERAVFKEIYNFLFHFRVKNDQEKFKRLLLKEGINPSKINVELYLQPVLRFNEPLKKMFPNAEVHYFEHGIGDYLDVLKEKRGIFHCVFYDGFERYLEAAAIPGFSVRSIADDLQVFDPESLIHLFPELASLEGLREDIVLVVTQPLEDLGVPDRFWQAFLKRATDKVDNPKTKLFLIKIHPRQNVSSVKAVSEYLKSKGLKVMLMEEPQINNISMEILYKVIAKKVSYVISPYSSSVFYLPKLYGREGCRFLYSLKALEGYDQFTPVQYKKRWKLLHQLISTFGINQLADEIGAN